MHGERHPLPLGGAGAQDELAALVVVADRHCVVPAIADPEVLQDDDWSARRHLPQEVLEARRQLVGDQAMAACRGKHFDLQAALALRDVDLGDQRFRRDLDAGGGESRGERSRSALVLLLREERHLGELGFLREAARQPCAQLGRLRPHAGAARGEERNSANKNARDRAGVLCGLAAE